MSANWFVPVSHKHVKFYSYLLSAETLLYRIKPVVPYSMESMTERHRGLYSRRTNVLSSNIKNAHWAEKTTTTRCGIREAATTRNFELWLFLNNHNAG